jgi:DNA-binding transcriptional MerR regulator
MTDKEFTLKEWQERMAAFPDDDECDCDEHSLCDHLRLRVEMIEDQIAALQEMQQIMAKELLRRR